MRFLGLLVLFVVSALNACATEVFPSKAGSEWTLRISITSPKGTVERIVLRRQIGGPVQKGAKTYSFVRQWVDHGSFVVDRREGMRIDGTGFYSADLKQNEPKEELVYALPLEVGKSWANGQAEVVAAEDVEVNGVTYKNCYHVRTKASDGSYTTNAWVAAGVGEVKSETIYQTGAKIQVELLRFKSAQK